MRQGAQRRRYDRGRLCTQDHRSENEALIQRLDRAVCLEHGETWRNASQVSRPAVTLLSRKSDMTAAIFSLPQPPIAIFFCLLFFCCRQGFPGQIPCFPAALLIPGSFPQGNSSES